MTALFTILVLLGQTAPATLAQVRAEPNLERRAKFAIEYAMTAERAAEAAYSNNDMAGVTAELKEMQTAVEIAQEAFAHTGRTPQRHPGPYKNAELRTEEMLVRLGDLEKRMDADERSVIAAPRAKVQQIHDAWFEGIMGRKK